MSLLKPFKTVVATWVTGTSQCSEAYAALSSVTSKLGGMEPGRLLVKDVSEEERKELKEVYTLYEVATGEYIKYVVGSESTGSSSTTIQSDMINRWNAFFKAADPLWDNQLSIPVEQDWIASLRGNVYKLNNSKEIENEKLRYLDEAKWMTNCHGATFSYANNMLDPERKDAPFLGRMSGRSKHWQLDPEQCGVDPSNMTSSNLSKLGYQAKILETKFNNTYIIAKGRFKLDLQSEQGGGSQNLVDSELVKTWKIQARSKAVINGLNKYLNKIDDLYAAGGTPTYEYSLTSKKMSEENKRIYYEKIPTATPYKDILSDENFLISFNETTKRFELKNGSSSSTGASSSSTSSTVLKSTNGESDDIDETGSSNEKFPKSPVAEIVTDSEVTEGKGAEVTEGRELQK